jgi:beta-carotene 3-hydroxylase
MSILFILVVLLSFLGMEAAAWLAHKYIMHGFLWHIHEDHHRGGYTPFQKNDAFFLIFAIPSWLCIMLGSMNGAPLVVAIGFGILLYGFTYFIVHDVIIHQRFKWFSRSNNKFIRTWRWAHKMHHKQLGKHESESFGMLFVSKKYWDKVRRDEAIQNNG